MTVEIRPFPRDLPYRRFAEVIAAAFGEEATEAELPNWERLSERDRILCAAEGETLVGGGAAFSFRLTVPGDEVPAAGVTAVGVLPSHRRRGILTQMMRRQLDDVRERGEPVAILWASEGNIYQRFGYGLTSLTAAIEIERSRTAFRVPFEPEGQVRLVGRDVARNVFPTIYDRLRAERPGFLDRSSTWWEVEVLADPESRRRGAGPKFYAVHEVDGRPEGYAIYRIRHDWDPRGPKSVLEVRELIATSIRATRELWRFVFDVDLIQTIRADQLQPDHPLLLLLAEPRRLGLTVSDALWLRIVDLRGALAARSYREPGSLDVEVIDSFCPWNAGCWRLEVDGSGRRVERMEGRAGLRLDAADMAAVYLGAFTFADLARAGRAVELSDGALSAADRLFATDGAPWCPQVF